MVAAPISGEMSIAWAIEPCVSPFRANEVSLSHECCIDIGGCVGVSPLVNVVGADHCAHLHLPLDSGRRLARLGQSLQTALCSQYMRDLSCPRCAFHISHPG